MERRIQRTRTWRAAFGVLLMYALALQGVLGGVAVTRMSLQSPGVICSGHLTNPEGEQNDATGHESCCSIACRMAQPALASRLDDVVPVGVPSLARERRWLTVRFHGPPTRSNGSANPRAPPAGA